MVKTAAFANGKSESQDRRYREAVCRRRRPAWTTSRHGFSTSRIRQASRLFFDATAIAQADPIAARGRQFLVERKFRLEIAFQTPAADQFEYQATHEVPPSARAHCLRPPTVASTFRAGTQ